MKPHIFGWSGRVEVSREAWGFRFFVDSGQLNLGWAKAVPACEGSNGQPAVVFTAYANPDRGANEYEVPSRVVFEAETHEEADAIMHWPMYIDPRTYGAEQLRVMLLSPHALSAQRLLARYPEDSWALTAFPCAAVSEPSPSPPNKGSSTTLGRKSEPAFAHFDGPLENVLTALPAGQGGASLWRLLGGPLRLVFECREPPASAVQLTWAPVQGAAFMYDKRLVCVHASYAWDVWLLREEPLILGRPGSDDPPGTNIAADVAAWARDSFGTRPPPPLSYEVLFVP